MANPTVIHFPTFAGDTFTPFEMRQFVSALELRFQGLEAAENTVGDATTGSELSDLDLRYARLNHLHVESEVTDLQNYLINITNESIFELDDVITFTGAPNPGSILSWDSVQEQFELVPGNTSVVNLADLNDVFIPNIQDNDIIFFSGVTQQWESIAIADLPTSTFENLIDTDLSAQQQYDLVFNVGSNIWQSTNGDIGWHDQDGYLQLANARAINWTDLSTPFAITQEFIVFGQQAGAAPEASRASVQNHTNTTTASVTYVDVTGSVILDSALNSGDDYVLLIKCVSENATVNNNRIRVTQGDVLMVGSEQNFQSSGGVGGTSGNPYMFATVFTAGGGDIQLEHHTGGSGTIETGYTDMLAISITDLGLNTNVFHDVDTSTVNLTAIGPISTGASITIGDGVSDWLVFGSHKTDNFTSSSSFTIDYDVNDGAATRPAGHYQIENLADELSAGYVQLYQGIASTTLTVEADIPFFTCDKVFTSIIAIRLNAFAQYDLTYDADPAFPPSGVALDVLTTSFTTNAGVGSNWMFFSSVMSQANGSPDVGEFWIPVGLDGGGDVTEAGSIVYTVDPPALTSHWIAFPVWSEDVTVNSGQLVDADLRHTPANAFATDDYEQAILAAWSWELASPIEVFTVGNTGYRTDLLGSIIRIPDLGETDWLDQYHDSTNYNFEFINTADWDISGIAGAINMNWVSPLDANMLIASDEDKAILTLHSDFLGTGISQTRNPRIQFFRDTGGTQGTANIGIASTVNDDDAAGVAMIDGTAGALAIHSATTGSRVQIGAAGRAKFSVGVNDVKFQYGTDPTTRYSQWQFTGAAGEELHITHVNMEDWKIQDLTGSIFMDNSLKLQEQNVADTNDATYGQFWVRDDAPNVPMFSDDTGADFNLLSAGGGGSLPTPTVADSTLRSNGSSDWFEATRVLVSAAGVLTIQDSGLTDWAAFSHNSTDFLTAFTLTAGWNITGLTTFNVVNYSFNVDQTVGVGQDNFILTYDDVSGEIGLEAAVHPAEVNDLTASVTWANIPDANVPETAVTQHEAALTILESQITDGTILARVAGTETISGDWTWSGRLVTDDSTTTRAGFNIPTGVAPTVPVQGDMWVTAADAFIRINGVSESLLGAGGVPTAITVASEVADTTSFPAFFTAETGDLEPKTNTGLTFNAATADLVSTLMAGIANADLVDKSDAETISGDWTWTGRVVTDDSTTVRAGFNIPTGVAPTVPVQGDMWAVATDAFIRINGVTESIIGGGAAEINDLSAAVTWINVPDANITEGSVTQHEAALTILESQITDGAILARVAGTETISGAWTHSGRLVTDDSTTVRAGFNIPEGVAPTTPVDGDMWVTTTDAFIEINGVSESIIFSSADEINDLSASVTWANVPDANITETSVTQHEAALTILESQITDGTILARVAGTETISGDWTWSGRLVTDDSTTTRAGFNVAEGVAPTVPVDGDVWVTAAGAFFARLNGVSVDLSVTGGITDGTVTGSGLIWSGSAWVEALALTTETFRLDWLDDNIANMLISSDENQAVLTIHSDADGDGILQTRNPRVQFTRDTAGLQVNGNIGIASTVAQDDAAGNVFVDSTASSLAIHSQTTGSRVQIGAAGRAKFSVGSGDVRFQYGTTPTLRFSQWTFTGAAGEELVISHNNMEDWKIQDLTGSVFMDNSLKLQEQTASDADDAGYGQWWVRDDAPTTPMFTADDGAEFNLLADTAVSEVVVTTNVITADESGTTFYLDLAGGFTSTLPVVAAGLRYRFVVKTAPTTAYIIGTNAGANIFFGTINEITTTAGISIQADDQIDFVAVTALIGDWVEVDCDGTNWYVHGVTQVDGGIATSVT